MVEDHEQVRAQLTELLTSAGFSVRDAVGTAREGELAITSHPPDVAVIDNQLPDGLGINLCRTLARTTPQVTLLLHTGVITKDLERQARHAGVTVIPKAIRPDNLLNAIRNHHNPPTT